MSAEDQYQTFALMEPLHLAPCKICHGISKDKCMFCGQKCPAPKDLNDKQKIQLTALKDKIAYLKKLYKQLIALKMTTTGCEVIDKEVENTIGNWRQFIVGRPVIPSKLVVDYSYFR